MHLAGGKDVQAAGSIIIKRGKISQINNGSGHYRPTIEELSNFKEIFKTIGLNIDNATVIPKVT